MPAKLYRVNLTQDERNICWVSPGAANPQGVK